MTAPDDHNVNAHFPGPCREARDVVHLTIDAEATGQHTRLLEKHLADCAACRQYADQMNDVMAGIADLRAATDSASSADELYLEANESDLNRKRASFARFGVFRAAAMIALLLGSAWWIIEWMGDSQSAATPKQIASAPHNKTPSPDRIEHFDNSLDTTRIVSARSETHSFIPVKRETHSARVKLFFLYQSVNPVSNQ